VVALPQGRAGARRKKLTDVLRYVLEQGPTEKNIIEQCIRYRQPLPDKIANAPRLLLGLEMFYVAFADLTTCRYPGDKIDGRISWKAITDWCDAFGIVGEQREDVYHHIFKMDEVYLDHQLAKYKAAQPKPPAKGGKYGKRK
jgi:hypothetical protein